MLEKRTPMTLNLEKLKKQIENLLGIKLDKFRIYKRYDIESRFENIEKIIYTVLSEKPVDEVYYGEDALKLQAQMKNAIAVEYLPGQFDQRKQGVLDTVSLIIDDEFDLKLLQSMKSKEQARKIWKKSKNSW
jgi:phosphoribosylformylglycinamidine synthase